MSSVLMTMLPVSFQIAVLAVLLFLSVRLIRENGRQLIVVFLTFLFTMWLLTDLYWVIYDFMRPDSRMPFAVNEIGEATLFLLIRGLAVGVMHIDSVFALTLGLVIARRFRAMRLASVIGALSLSMLFHGIYNLLVSEPGVTSAVGFALPLAMAAVLLGFYRRLQAV